MPPYLTLYGGLGEIGGNKILLEEEGVRLWLDFGTPFGRHKRYFNEYLGPRAARGLWDFLALGLLPPLQGLYRKDLELPGLWSRFAPRRRIDSGDGPLLVLLSHAHLDHLGDVAFLDPGIPLVATPESAAMARAVQIAGPGGAPQEWTYTGEREADGEGRLRSKRQEPYRNRPFHLLGGVPPGLGEWWGDLPGSRKAQGDPPTPFSSQVGSLRVRWWPVDHSIPGAVALAVETRVGWVAYTGDLRFHGRGKEKSLALAEAWAGMGIALLLSEGTRLGDPAPQVGEEEVLGEALALTRKAEGRLVVADFAPRHVERLQVFLEVARETGRRLALQPKDAFLLEALAQASPLFQGVLQDPHLALYDDVKTSPRPWEKGVRERWAKVLVGPEEVGRDPGGYILALSLWDLNDLLDLPEGGLREGLYLYANSPAYDEEAALDLERLRGWVRHLGLRLEGDPEGRTSRLHASGHAGEADLVALVREVRPQVLIPVHTESPGRWREVLGELGGTRVFLPQEGERVDLEGLLRG